uniref:Solute carrier family 25 member 32b n=1 Tax=Lepisosteus oculatus TaxID=7918 RepID=W5MTB0_LEPOC
TVTLSDAPSAPSSPFPGKVDLQRLFSHVRYENLVAGLSGGVVSTLVLHPLDLVKIRFAGKCFLLPRGKIDTVAFLYAKEFYLYIFFIYNAIKSYKQESNQSELTASQHLVSAAQAGALTLCITNPIWVTKTRLVLQYDAGIDPSKRQYKGMFDALLKIYRYEGIPGLYRGFVPGLFGTSHGALQFMAYEELKREYSKYKNMPAQAQLNPLEYVTMAAMSKIFAVSVTYPYQVIRARLQDQHNKYAGLTDVIRRTWSNEGVRGFYKGIVPNVIRVTPACCITFVVYENVSSFLRGLRGHRE